MGLQYNIQYSVQSPGLIRVPSVSIVSGGVLVCNMLEV